MSAPNRKRKRVSKAWEYFIANEDYSQAECMDCHELIKTIGGSTTSLFRHLESAHRLFLNVDPSNDGPCKKMNPTEIIAKLAGMDGFSFNSIASSETIHELYKSATNSSLPTSGHAVKRAVLKFYGERKNEIVQKISQLKRQGKLSITLDEWSSCANRRYMGITAHIQNQFWCLGLQPIAGTFTSEACYLTLVKKLGEFDINLDDVFSVVTDGASVMKKFGRDSGRQHQLCLAHGIHLAVSDVLYKRSDGIQVDLTPENTVESEEEVVEIEDSSESEDMNTPFMIEDLDIEYVDPIANIIKEVRRIVKMFHYSPKKNEILIRHAGKDLNLILDTRTRWNSLVNMLERFYDLRDSVKKAMIDVREPFKLSDGDLKLIKDVVDTLQPVKVAAEKICRRDANLVSADLCITFMLDKLAEIDSDLGRSMFEAIKKRMLERRTHISDVASFLHFAGNNSPGQDKKYFCKPSTQVIASYIRDIYQNNIFQDRLDLDLSQQDLTQDQESQSLLNEVTLEMQLNDMIKKAQNYNVTTSARAPRDLLSKIRNEISVLKSTGQRGSILDYVHQLVMSVPPSSVESERVFSSSNNFCSRTRSRLGDDALDALVFLRSYFKNLSLNA